MDRLRKKIDKNFSFLGKVRIKEEPARRILD